MDFVCSDQSVDENFADFIIEYEQFPQSFRESPGFCAERINNVYSVAYVPISSLPNNIIQQYSYSIFPSCFGLLQTDSLDASGVTQIQKIPTLNLTGEGVLIGIIDTGIEYTHEAFKNADGTTRIVSIWDQTIQNAEQRPLGFYYGTEYHRDQINRALASDNPLTVVPSTDENGHGTFLAGIAAGGRNEVRNFSGVAPDAQIIVVKLKQAKRYLRNFFSIPLDVDCFQENDIMLGVKYLVENARRLGQPISICIGIGSSQSSHDGRHSLANYLSTVADESGIGVSIAAGNEGTRRHHYSGIVDPSIGYDTVELKVGAGNQGFAMELWGNSPNLFSIDVLSPAGEYISRIPARLNETREINFIFEKTKLFVDYDIVETQTGDELILIRFQNPSEGIWRFRVYSSIIYNPRFNIWLPITNFIGPDTFFNNSDPDTTLTAPANASIPIIATAYNHRNGSIFIDASRGFTRNNMINPTLAAPGVELLGPALHNSYTVLTGTSIAAAFMTGAVAMIQEWGRNNQRQFDTLEIKNYLIRGAKREQNRTYPSKEWGYGILDLYNTFNSLRG